MGQLGRATDDWWIKNEVGWRNGTKTFSGFRCDQPCQVQMVNGGREDSAGQKEWFDCTIQYPVDSELPGHGGLQMYVYITSKKWKSEYDRFRYASISNLKTRRRLITLLRDREAIRESSGSS